MRVLKNEQECANAVCVIGSYSSSVPASLSQHPRITPHEMQGRLVCSPHLEETSKQRGQTSRPR